MISILHVIDGGSDETALQSLETLRARLSGDDIRHRFFSIATEARSRAATWVRAPVALAPRLLPTQFLNYSSALRRGAESAAIIHAWGVEAAVMARATMPNAPLVLTVIDPARTTDAARWMRSFSKGATIIAGSQLILSQLLSSGVPPEQLVVIRGAVDFGAINAARRENIRSGVVGDRKPVVLLAGPPSRGAGQEAGIWASAIIRYLYRDLTVLLPYDSQESLRMQRWAGTLPAPDMVVKPDARLSWAQLVSCADVFLQPAQIEVCTEPLAYAMAGGLPIVATAIRSIAEMIADRHNGLLVKNASPRLVASRLLTALEDTALARQVAETARGQSFKVFGLRDFADNHRRVYENVLANRSASDGVSDTAMVA